MRVRAYASVCVRARDQLARRVVYARTLSVGLRPSGSEEVCVVRGCDHPATRGASVGLRLRRLQCLVNQEVLPMELGGQRGLR